LREQFAAFIFLPPFGPFRVDLALAIVEADAVGQLLQCCHQ
jgi:hypothetical protein